jgi:hypothetical protein
MRTGYDGELSSQRKTSLAEWRRHNEYCWRVGNLRRCGVQPSPRYCAASRLQTRRARKTPRNSSSLNTAHRNRKLHRGTSRNSDIARRNVELRGVRGQIVVEMKTHVKLLPRLVLGERVERCPYPDSSRLPVKDCRRDDVPVSHVSVIIAVCVCFI